MQTDSLAFDTLTEEFPEVGQPGESFATHMSHWRCHTDQQRVQWWCLDRAESNTNLLSTEVLEELQELVAQAQAPQNAVKGVVIRSLKKKGFIAGADIGEFRGQTDAEAVEQTLARGREILFSLERLAVPTIALLHGFCLGGGLELALACRYRLARPDTKLGFPEVNLGLHPGLSGTVRLTRLISPPEALKMMLTGKPVPAKKALKLGLVDAVCEEHHFANAVIRAVAGKVESQGEQNKAKLFNLGPATRLIAQQSEKQTRKKVSPEHFPAPFALIDLYRHYGSDPESMHREEGRSFAKLLTGHTSQQLIRVFFLRESLKATQPSTIESVHVVGAGAMGGDIASWCALKGLTVTLEDKAAEQIAPALQRAGRLFSQKCKSQVEHQQAHDRLIPDLRGYGRKRADLIIEAVPEELELKTQVLRELEEAKKEGALLATNTSSLLLQSLREGLQTGADLVGIHFFNPVAKMPLVEIVSHDQLPDAVRDRAEAFVSRIGRLPVRVKSSPGFLVNRVLTPYLLEAMALLDEGYSKEEIDRAAEQFGMPMGPVELADFIGLDICLHVAETLHEQLEQPLYPIPAWFRQLVDANKLGSKSGEGFYKYDEDGNPDKNKGDDSPADTSELLQDRLFLPLINTCVHCLDENLVEDRDQVDAAMIFAVGFPPFTGGPLQYARDRGVDAIKDRLQEFADSKNGEKHAERFTPARGWDRVAQDSVETNAA